jgi:hypothetical protein
MTEPVVHIPLGVAQLCMDCESVSNMAFEACPGCASTAVVPLRPFVGGSTKHPDVHVSEIQKSSKGESDVESK